MCGICGVLTWDGRAPGPAPVRSMMHRLSHRGPDDEGLFLDPGVGLGHRRLSIIDLSEAGRQPFTSNDGRHILIFNGEIYNYIELRQELKGTYEFLTRTDTEVLLAAYQRWGRDCLQRLNGMYAFAVWDTHVKSLFIARDPFGVKPLYYTTTDEGFFFASEIPPLLNHTSMPARANESAIFDYFAFNRTDQTESTFFDGVRKLQHGHFMDVERSGVSVKRWYRLRDRIHRRPDTTPEQFHELFTSSIGLQLRSDVPVGVCLSGGLDSSSIVSELSTRFERKDVHTFSAIYGLGQKGDESAFIRQYEGTLRNMHFVTPSASTLASDIARFISVHGEPVPSTSPYAQFKVMELAASHATVTLDGQGADEQLAGYHYFFGFFFKELLRQGRLLSLSSEVLHYLRKHGSLYGVASLAFLLLPRWIRTRARVREKGYLTGDFAGAHQDQSVISGELYGSRDLHESLINHFEYKLEHLLKWEDRNSMAFSIEARVPFLDHRLVEFTLGAASECLINRGETKYLLREAMRGTLPDEIRTRQDKVGFGTPEGEWFRTSRFQEIVGDLLSTRSFRERGFVDVEVARNMYREHLSGERDVSKEIWKWLNVELWHQQFVDPTRLAV
jgi:asparagine synthase (glutamine-hydrolysing)